MNGKKSYNTRPRDRILKSISSFETAHFTVSDVVARLRAEGQTVGRATVYRTVERMAEDGELRKYIVDGTTAACYQRVEGNSGASCREHFHLKCEKCGRLIHAECEELRKIVSHMKEEHRFLIDSSKTVFYGLCEDCAGEEELSAGEKNKNAPAK